jgi:hypothetical protein
MRWPHVLRVKIKMILFSLHFFDHDYSKFLSTCEGSSPIHESQDAIFQETNGSSTCGTDMADGARAKSSGRKSNKHSRRSMQSIL